jgi:hypothetical protein
VPVTDHNEANTGLSWPFEHCFCVHD